MEITVRQSTNSSTATSEFCFRDLNRRTRCFHNDLSYTFFFSGHDTVGAVALDCHGNLACATSTGGITAQMVGRVSDSPIGGAGGFADNDSGILLLRPYLLRSFGGLGLLNGDVFPINKFIKLKF